MSKVVAVCVFLVGVFIAEGALTQQQVIKIAGKTMTLTELKQALPVDTISIKKMPVYPTENMRFDGFNMKVLLKKIFKIDDESELAEHCLLVQTLDKFEPCIPLETFFNQGQAYLVFRQSPQQQKVAKATKDGLWTEINAHGRIYDPGPFYLIWTHNKDYPQFWPFQVINLSIEQKN